MSDIHPMDGIIGRFIADSDRARDRFIDQLRPLLRDRAVRDDARHIIRAYRDGAVEEDQALDLLGFGEPMTGEEQAA